MLTVAVISDLHFEFRKGDSNWMPPLPTDCDVLVLAGDIGLGQGALDAVFKIADALPETYIIWVAGNHEFYRQSIDKQLAKYRAACAGNPQIHFLENETVNIDCYRFLGCTLWSGFDCLGLEKRCLAMQEAQYAISDFSLIRKDGGSRPFSAVDAGRKFTESYS